MVNTSNAQPGGLPQNQGTADKRYVRKTARTTKEQKPLPKKFVEFTEDEKREANTNIALAFQLLGLVADGQLVCPECGGSKRKVQAKVGNNPYWKCHKCKAYGSVINLLKEKGGYTYPDAVNTLLGRPTTGAVREVSKVELPKIVLSQSFKADVDIDIYDFIRNSGSLQAAQKYYETVAHIKPEVVAESGSTYITDARKLQKELTTKFSMERLKKAGVVTVDKNDRDLFLFSDDYCVIEPHERACKDLIESWRDYVEKAKKAKAAGEDLPDAPFVRPTCSKPAADGHGHVVGMQFRPSLKQRALVDAHKKWKKKWSGIINRETGKAFEPTEAWQAMHDVAPSSAGEKIPYVVPFLSLKGATPESLVGCGLKRLSSLKPGQKIYVVEGFKDWLAARSMNIEAYAIPGTGVLPGEHICKLLRLHIMVPTLDGDAAGAEGRKNLELYFDEVNIKHEPNPNIREGMDVADILIDRYAKNGCTCDTCVDWRQSH